MMQKHLILLTVLMTAMLSGCQEVQKVFSLQKPTVKMTGLHFEDVSLESANLLFDVEVENHYSTPLPLTNMDYSVSTSGSQFVSGSANLQQIIPAKSTKTISLPINVNYLQVISALQGIDPGQKIPYQADLNLSLTTPALGDITLPISKQGQLDLPEIGKTAAKTLLENILSK